MSRLPEPWGTRLDRSRRLRFRFEGRAFEGFQGDTIASALAANGQWMLSRSFKYHRPRGVFSMAGAEANPLVQVGEEPNVAADLVALEDGMEVRAQNVAGSLAWDRDAALGLVGRFLPVGFYYRAFGRRWERWEPLFRRKAGLGRVDPGAVPARHDKGFLHCDLLVVGGGPAGVAAALAAAGAGADVILCEAEPELGASAPEGVRVMTGTLCNGFHEDNWLALIRGRMLYRVRAGQVILATGGIDQPAVFRNNDLPGIMTGTAMLRLMRLYGVRPGRRVAVCAPGGEGLEVARELAGIGALAAVIGPGGEGHVAEARGRRHVEAVRVGARWIACDGLAVCAGRMPAWQLPCQAGARLVVEDGRIGLRLDRAGVHLAGVVNGCEGLEAAVADGQRAAEAALGRGSAQAGPGLPLCPLPLSPHPEGKDFVDFDEDLTVADIRNAVAEGYSELELVKRFSTVGMGPSQGRHSALATARIVAEATGRDLGDVGVTTARPPVAPETLGQLAGRIHAPERRSALHARHIALGAEMRAVGAWRRPYRYGAVEDEVRAVREGAGLLDVSTLGKLEVRGPDAGAFLDRLYTMAHAGQPVGRVRYGLMLNEMGAVVDDGVVCRLAEDVFYVTASTGAAGRVFAEMAAWNARWGMAVDVANLTGAFAALNVTGPRARAVLAALPRDLDLSPEGFGYLEVRTGHVAGVPVRALRIGFTGEVSFELHCPASQAPALWDALMAVGGLVPCGLDALRLLRLEKGHLLIGQDTDALSSPDELGLGWALSRKKPFYVGKRSVEMRRRLGLKRRLVGLRFGADAELPGEGCLVLREGAPVGHVTSAALSPTLGHGIALAWVHPEDAAEGAVVTIRARSGRVVEGSVGAFHDPANERQKP